ARQGERVGLLGGDRSQLFLAVAVLTMFLSPFLIRIASAVDDRRRRSGSAKAADPGAERGPVVVIVGYGLNGQNLSRVLGESGIEYRVLEMNVDTVRTASAAGIPISFGDASREETLLHAGIQRAQIIVFAISDPGSARRGVSTARRLSPSIHVIVRTRFMSERPDLLKLGADEVIPEEFETSIEIFSRVLRRLHVPRGNIAAQAALVRREGYQLLREEMTPERTLDAMREVLGENAVDTLLISGESPVTGRSLGELDLRSRTGVSVVSVVRDGEAIHGVGPHLRLEPNDVLLVVGLHDAIERCRALLTGHAFDDDDS
ncbi:MAG: NAD-binding protein, partial [Planctomycetota bacterium JB042]